MPNVDHAARLITCKLVYCGPAHAGKTTNLSFLHSALPADQVGSLTSWATRFDRTLCFDYIPHELDTFGAYRVRFQLYTVAGPSENRAIHRLAVEGADGVAFVADSRRERLGANLESLRDLHADLAEHDVDARSLPFVFQFNKRDLPEEQILSVDELSVALNFRRAPEFAASACNGTGAMSTFRTLGTQVLHRLGASDAVQPELLDASV